MFFRGLVLGLLTGAFSAPSGEWGTWLPGLIFAANFLPWRQVWWRKLAATAVSLGAWWVAFKGASSAGKDLPKGLDLNLFWAQWGAVGALLLGLGLLALGFFEGKRRWFALPLMVIVGAIAAQPFDGAGDRELYFGFMAWQGSIAALLSVLTQTQHHHDL